MSVYWYYWSTTVFSKAGPWLIHGPKSCMGHQNPSIGSMRNFWTKSLYKYYVGGSHKKSACHGPRLKNFVWTTDQHCKKEWKYNYVLYNLGNLNLIKTYDFFIFFYLYLYLFLAFWNWFKTGELQNGLLQCVK